MLRLLGAALLSGALGAFADDDDHGGRLRDFIWRRMGGINKLMAPAPDFNFATAAAR